MNIYTFDIEVSFDISSVKYADKIDVTACKFDVALEKLCEAVQDRHTDAIGVKVKSFYFKIK